MPRILPLPPIIQLRATPSRVAVELIAGDKSRETSPLAVGESLSPFCRGLTASSRPLLPRFPRETDARMGQEAAPVSSAAIVIVERKDGLNGNYTGQVEKGRRRGGGGLDGSVPLVTHLVPPLNKASRNEWSLSRSRPQPPPIAPSLSPSLPSLHPLLLDVFLASSVYGVSRNWPHRDSIVVETAVYGFYGLLYQIFSPLFGDLECRSASSRVTTLAYINYCTLSGWRTIYRTHGWNSAAQNCSGIGDIGARVTTMLVRFTMMRSKTLISLESVPVRLRSRLRPCCCLLRISIFPKCERFGSALIYFSFKIFIFLFI